METGSERRKKQRDRDRHSGGARDVERQREVRGRQTDRRTHAPTDTRKHTHTYTHLHTFKQIDKIADSLIIAHLDVAMPVCQTE